MSYLDQQKKVEAENEKLRRRKIDDELEIQKVSTDGDAKRFLLYQKEIKMIIIQLLQ